VDKFEQAREGSANENHFCE